MLQRPETIEDRIRRYEGLVHKTASLMVGKVPDHDFDDLCSVFRIKVWQALESFDGRHKSGLTEERYVFSCIVNLKKDISGTKNRRGNDRFRDTRGREISLDELGFTDSDERHDRFDHPALAVDPEQVFAEIESGGAFLPSTLTDRERRVICYLYAGYNQTEITSALKLTKREMENAMRAVRVKMADWRPAPAAAEREEIDGRPALVEAP